MRTSGAFCLQNPEEMILNFPTRDVVGLGDPATGVFLKGVSVAPRVCVLVNQ
jgi:hypothetical protein